MRTPLARRAAWLLPATAALLLLLDSPARAAGRETERLERIGSHAVCAEAPGLAGWLVRTGELWSLERVLAGRAEGSAPRAVVISFFGTWCEPCLAGLDVLQSQASRLGEKGVRVILVAVPPFEEDKPLPDFLRSRKLTLPTIQDKFGGIWERWGGAKPGGAAPMTVTLPRTAVVRADGRLVAVFGQEGDDFASVLMDTADRLPTLCDRPGR